MSKIGKKFIQIPAEVKIELTQGKAVVQGPKGNLKIVIPAGIEVKIEKDLAKVTRKNNQRQTKAFHGLVRSSRNTCRILNFISLVFPHL